MTGAAFELERFTFGDDRLEVAGRWRAGELRRFRRVRLLVDAGGRVRRLAPLGAAPLTATPDGTEWSASFRYRGPAVERAELEVGRDLAVALPAPVPAETVAAPAVVLEKPVGPSVLAAAVQAPAPRDDFAREQAALEALSAELRAERGEVEALRAALRAEREEVRAEREELQAERAELRSEREALEAAQAEAERTRSVLERQRREAAAAPDTAVHPVVDSPHSPAAVASVTAPVTAPAGGPPRRSPRPVPHRAQRRPADLRIVAAALAVPALIIFGIIGDTLL